VLSSYHNIAQYITILVVMFIVVRCACSQEIGRKWTVSCASAFPVEKKYRR
jgi:hypothetical protein